MLHPVRGLLEHTTPRFRQLLIELALRIGADPTALAAVMSFETGGTFRANIQNPASGATGLIQFLPSTARRLGTTVEALARLSPEDQLLWVERFFRSNGSVGKFATVADHYMAVFAPAKMGTPDSTVLYRQGGQAYSLNQALDATRDGTITKAEAARHVLSLYNAAKELAPVAGEAPKRDALPGFPDRPESPTLVELKIWLAAELTDLRLVVESRCDEIDGRLHALLEEAEAIHAELERK